MGKLTKKIGEPDPDTGPKHVEDHIYDYNLPPFVRAWITINRLPAMEKETLVHVYGVPKLFADSPDLPGIRVRVTMASRLGDVGITVNLNREHGYDKRVMFDTLSNFTWEKPDGA